MKFKTLNGEVDMRRSARGTVIVLVVAVLALLAVIGTVYIVSARADRASAQAMNANANLNLTRLAAIQRVLERVGDAMMDNTGRVGGYTPVNPARVYTYPDGGEAFLVGHLHRPAASLTNELTQLTPNAFNPQTGTYSLPLVTFPWSNALSTVVGDRTNEAPNPANTDTTGDDPPNLSPTGADAYIDLLPFSDASGVRYRVGIRILDTSRMANLNTGAIEDSAAPYTDQDGSYFTGVRLAMPTSEMPTTHAFFNPTDVAARLHATTPATSGIGRSGKSLMNPTYGVQNWQQQILRYERPSDVLLAFFDLADELDLRSYGQFGTAFNPRPASVGGSATDYRLWPLTLSSKPGSPTSANVTGNPRRRNYTTYSWSREIRPYPDPAFADIRTLTPTGSVSGTPNNYLPAPSGIPIWPTAPARVSVNLPLGNGAGDISAQKDALFNLAMIATNIATAMRDSTANTLIPIDATVPAYTEEEIASFVANFCTFRWNGFARDPDISSATAYWLPAGPSFVDKNGLCVRTADTSTPPNKLMREFSGARDVKTLNAADKIYLGYAAQPFLNEVAAKLHYEVDPDTQAKNVIVTDFAVELYNPYDVALSLKGFRIKFKDGSVPLDGQYIPARGWFVLKKAGSMAIGTPTPPPTSYQPADTTNMSLDVAGGRITLQREYYDRSQAQQFATVDEFDYSRLVTDPEGDPDPAMTEEDKEFSVQRDNNANPAARWVATIPMLPARAEAQTLGNINTKQDGVGGIELFDRYASTPVNAPTPQQGSPFVNIREFNRIMRISHEIDGPSEANPNEPSTPHGLITTQGNAIMQGQAAAPAPYDLMQFPGDAQIHFDFYAAPWNYNATPPQKVLVAAPNGATKPGDIRAVRLLEHLAFVDRFSDFNIDVGMGNHDISKIRLPGQINVNTASGDVLRAIPNITNKLVANILAYRDRKKDVKYGLGSAANEATSDDFTDVNKFPGRGIRSLSELLVPMLVAGAANISDRDALWASLYNYCTVRSDTFVVYGYIEAVRVHPNSLATHNNGSDWYGAVSDDPTSGGPNLRLAKRRWVAIIDRSFCNYDKNYPAIDIATGGPHANAGQPNRKFSLPKVVAIKDLPQ